MSDLSVATMFLSIAFIVYIGSLKVVEGYADVNRPVLKDVGHALLPEYPALKDPTDLLGFVCLGWALYEGFLNDNKPLTRWILCWVTAGFFFSTTLHCGTIISDARWVQQGRVPNPIFGSFCDRLMSNHVYGLGVALLAAEAQYPRLVSWRMTICVLVVYGMLILMAREHYTVDIVLALWCVVALRVFVTKDTPTKGISTNKSE